MKVYSIEKTELYFIEETWRTMYHNIVDIVSSKKKAIDSLFYLGVTNQKGKTNEEWEMTMFPTESYTKKFTISEYKYKDVVTIKEWEIY